MAYIDVAAFVRLICRDSYSLHDAAMLASLCAGHAAALSPGHHHKSRYRDATVRR